MSQLKTFQFMYEVRAENIKKAIGVIREIEENEGMQPTCIINDDGKVLTYNDYVVHKFMDHGGISDEEFIEILSSKV